MVYLKAKRNITRTMLDRYHANPAIHPIKKGDAMEAESFTMFPIVKLYISPARRLPGSYFTEISEEEFCKAIDDKYLND